VTILHVCNFKVVIIVDSAAVMVWYLVVIGLGFVAAFPSLSNFHALGRHGCFRVAWV
jgi:hypothetical protein